MCKEIWNDLFSTYDKANAEDLEFIAPEGGNDVLDQMPRMQEDETDDELSKETSKMLKRYAELERSKRTGYDSDDLESLELAKRSLTSGDYSAENEMGDLEAEDDFQDLTLIVERSSQSRTNHNVLDSDSDD